MKTLYLDIFSGISGDMFLGALIDLGVETQALKNELERLQLDGWRVHVTRGQKAQIQGVKFDVFLEHAPLPSHEHIHQHSHVNEEREHEQKQAAPHEHAQGENPAPGAHGGQLVKTSQGQVELSVFETNVPPRFRLFFYNAKGQAVAPPVAGSIGLETIRPDKNLQSFKFKRRGEYLEA